MDGIEDLPFIWSLALTCQDGDRLGWHERNAGNISYLLDDDEMARCRELLGAEGHAAKWISLDCSVSGLAGRFLAVSGAGCLMKNALSSPESTFCICEISGSGTEYRMLWGLENGRPTSEFPTHLLAHEARLEVGSVAGKPHRVIYHAHCPNVIALSNVLPASSREWTRTLWKCMTECILFFPEGVGVLPWMIPGGMGIARASADMLRYHPACVWTQHGLFSAGSDCEDAFGLARSIEKTAEIYLKARAACGGEQPPFDVADGQLIALCEDAGVIPHLDYLELDR